MNRQTDRQIDRETTFIIELSLNWVALIPIRMKQSKENILLTM